MKPPPDDETTGLPGCARWGGSTGRDGGLRRLGGAPHGPDPGFFVNALDYAILVGSMLGIAAYAVWKHPGKRRPQQLPEGCRETGWLTIGLSVMATQASAITFLSTPGQGYESGLGFVQNYFGAPSP
jgi:hypothetical protein